MLASTPRRVRAHEQAEDEEERSEQDRQRRGDRQADVVGVEPPARAQGCRPASREVETENDNARPEHEGIETGFEIRGATTGVQISTCMPSSTT